MKLAVVFSVLLLSLNSYAGTQAICSVKSTHGDVVVTVDLKEDYRYLVGKSYFSLAGLESMIEITTWEGKGGRVAQNNYDLAGLRVSNAGMKMKVQMESSYYDVDCQLK